MGVPTSVSMAPSREPKARGISTRDTGVFISRAAATTAGSKTAQAPTEFMKAERMATLAMVRAMSRTSLLPAARRIQAPRCAATPVEVRPALMTRMAPTAITAWLEKPLRACSTVMTRAKNRTSRTPKATRSGEKRPSASSSRATSVTTRTKAISKVTAGSDGGR